MDTIRLRTLTEKSILGFGKYNDFPVKYIIDRGHMRYLRWVYYNMSMISFMDDILDKIGIGKDYRIEKPGKNAELFKELNERKNKNTGHVEYKVIKSKTKKTKIAKAAQRKARERIYFSKASMQLRNHGR